MTDQNLAKAVAEIDLLVKARNDSSPWDGTANGLLSSAPFQSLQLGDAIARLWPQIRPHLIKNGGGY